MLEQAFEALKTYDWGSDRKPLAAIDEAVVTTHGNAEARKELETKLAEALKTNISRDAKDYLCRKLMIVGTAASALTLFEMLPDKDLSHMARFAFERIPGPEAAKFLRAALSKTSGAQKVGVIGSLGVRRDEDSVPALAKLLNDADASIARAAAYALGDIRTTQAADALKAAKAPKDAQPAVTDASLFCAEGLLAAGKKGEALAVFKAFANEEQPKHVRLAATKGMLACAGKKE